MEDRVVLSEVLRKRFWPNKPDATVDFCPHCNTTLGREQVWGDDRHWRTLWHTCHQERLEQWFFKTTKYAEETAGSRGINWPERVKVMQKNWIGRSEGAHVDFKTEQGDTLTVFTTRPIPCGRDVYGVALSIRWSKKLVTDAYREKGNEYVTNASKQTEIERTDADRKDRRFHRQLTRLTRQWGTYPVWMRTTC